jgi:hypothetical protein
LRILLEALLFYDQDSVEFDEDYRLSSR